MVLSLCVSSPPFFTMKTCTKCHVEKLETEFYRDYTRPSGLSTWCRSCLRKASSNWYHRDLMKGRKYFRDAQRQYYTGLRARAFDRLGGAHCARCGCDEFFFLEINHKTGGGTQERKGETAYVFYRKIANGERSPNGLEVLCAVCNALHKLEMRNSKQADRFTISWKALS